jgi:hypothetical protein
MRRPLLDAHADADQAGDESRVQFVPGAGITPESRLAVQRLGCGGTCARPGQRSTENEVPKNCRFAQMSFVFA